MVSNIYAVLLSWNGLEDTVGCINSLKNSSVPLTKIIVIDQNSPDGSGSRLEQLYGADDQVLVIRNERNCGFAEGVNIGIRRALDKGAEMVFLINNDTVVAEDCLRYLSEPFTLDPSIAAVGPAIMYYSNPEKLWQGGGYFNKFKMGIVGTEKGKNFDKMDRHSRSVTFLTGCAILIRRNAFETIGFFDTAFFFYGEDVDFCLRLGEVGMTLYYVPSARVLHKINDIAKDRTSPFVLYNLARHTVIMLRKRFSGPTQWYGISLQFTVYTIFRFLQILKGGTGWNSCFAWIRGLVHGLNAKI